MTDGDFFSTEQSTTVHNATSVRIQLVHAPDTSSTENGATTTMLKYHTPLQPQETIDASVMRVAALQDYFAREIQLCKQQGILLSLHLKATMMKVSDPIMFGHCVKVFFKDAFDKHAELFASLGVNANNGVEDVYQKIAGIDPAKKAEVEKDLQACYDNGPALAMVDSSKGITNLHVPNNVIIDASMPPVIRDGGRMWNANDELEDTKMLIPDRCYGGIYQAIVEDCQQHGKFDVATMGKWTTLPVSV